MKMLDRTGWSLKLPDSLEFSSNKELWHLGMLLGWTECVRNADTYAVRINGWPPCLRNREIAAQLLLGKAAGMSSRLRLRHWSQYKTRLTQKYKVNYALFIALQHDSTGRIK